MKDDKKKGIVTAIGLLILSMIIGFALSPYFIDYYFSKQPVYSISESIEKLNINGITLNKKSNVNDKEISLGQTIVLSGHLNNDFILTNIELSSDTYIQQQVILVHDKINCIPTKEGNYKVVGAYNLNNKLINNSSNSPEFNFGIYSYKQLDFYALWILGGCE